uniref:PEHE domain-containing protein n=1 Tax=Oryzias sinensis TaxID=183150 RepID=A0A8C7ZJL9_9TELE
LSVLALSSRGSKAHLYGYLYICLLVPRWKRAESRYAVERAAIISHWNWLQAHISDLEYRIRQQTDIYRQIRSSKVGRLLDSPAKGSVYHRHSTESKCYPSTRAEFLCVRPNRMAEGADGKQQQLAQDGTCVAARTRPLVSCRRRRLIQPNAVPNLNGKVSRESCNCRVNPSCVMCGGWPTPKEDPQFELPNLERLSRLDLGIHPILSFPDGPCSLRLQQIMKSQWQTKSLERSKPLKKLSLKHKLSSSKEKHKFTNSLMAKQRTLDGNMAGGSGGLLGAARLEGQAGCKTERLHTLSTPLGPYDKSYSRKRLREHSLERTDSSPKLFMDLSNPCTTLANMHSTLQSPLTRQLSTSSENSTPLGAGGQSVSITPQPIKRRRGESSFDINNIVIPMSVAATTRVEDLSDAAFIQLHQPYEDQERSRWTWMALAPAKRRGSRSYKSVDGRTTPLLCGTNPPTPQPASPDPGPYPLLHDYSHVPSPMSPPSPDTSSNPQTPCSRDSHRLLSNEDTRCSTPDFTFEERVCGPIDRRLLHQSPGFNFFLMFKNKDHSRRSSRVSSSTAVESELVQVVDYSWNEYPDTQILPSCS